jgi:hypothetical protein
MTGPCRIRGTDRSGDVGEGLFPSRSAGGGLRLALQPLSGAERPMRGSRLDNRESRRAIQMRRSIYNISTFTGNLGERTPVRFGVRCGQQGRPPSGLYRRAVGYDPPAGSADASEGPDHRRVVRGRGKMVGRSERRCVDTRVPHRRRLPGYVPHLKPLGTPRRSRCTASWLTSCQPTSWA